jgi:hypothetical protein
MGLASHSPGDNEMKLTLKLAVPSIVLGLMFLCAPRAHAQIMNEIYATIHHPFIVGNATLPAGRYDFRMIHNSQLEAMTVRNVRTNKSAEFLVRSSVDSHTPNHTDLIFNKFGHKEFLHHIYETGDKVGVTVIEPSREEARLLKQGHKPTVHTEKQSG